MFKVIIAGSRDFNDYETLCKVCNHMLSQKSEIEIVCGLANGADKLGKQYATERNFPVKEFPADCKKFGKSAGYKRNVQMSEYADGLICFWDGQSKGSNHMINLSKEKGLKIKIHIFERDEK